MDWKFQRINEIQWPRTLFQFIGRGAFGGVPAAIIGIIPET
jgi:hypothetical protein